MTISTTIGNVGIILSDKRLLENLDEAQKKLNMQVVADCAPLTPFQNGALRSSVIYPEGISGGLVEWNSPYAHYIYHGELYLAENGSSWARKYEKKYPSGKPLHYHQPGTGAEWFERAKEQHLNDWIRLVKETVGKN